MSFFKEVPRYIEASVVYSTILDNVSIVQMKKNNRKMSRTRKKKIIIIDNISSIIGTSVEKGSSHV